MSDRVLFYFPGIGRSDVDQLVFHRELPPHFAATVWMTVRVVLTAVWAA